MISLSFIVLFKLKRERNGMEQKRMNLFHFKLKYNEYIAINR